MTGDLGSARHLGEGQHIGRGEVGFGDAHRHAGVEGHLRGIVRKVHPAQGVHLAQPGDHAHDVGLEGVALGHHPRPVHMGAAVVDVLDFRDALKASPVLLDEFAEGLVFAAQQCAGGKDPVCPVAEEFAEGHAPSVGRQAPSTSRTLLSSSSLSMGFTQYSLAPSRSDSRAVSSVG